MSDEFPDEGAGRVLTDEELLNDVGGPMPSKYEGRLVLTKMVLENFKSYGGVKEIGPFHSSMSAVVGPNGSGKSNVIDALLFVFGKRASKLRLKKVSELIHKSRCGWGQGCARVGCSGVGLVRALATAGFGGPVLSFACLDVALDTHTSPGPPTPVPVLAMWFPSRALRCAWLASDG